MQEAVSAATRGAAVLAGGTELLNWLRLGISDVERLVDVGRIDSLRGIRQNGNELHIGALTTLNQVGSHPLVVKHAPVLSQACLKAASAQIRNLATLGGNILQKTRCPFFRAEAAQPATMPWPCNKRDPGSGCGARESGHPRLALFGWTQACVATQPSDPAVALTALDATVEILGPGGSRTIAMSGFHVTPEEAAREKLGGIGGEARVENRLQPGDVILGYRIPIDERSRHSAYVKVRERESYEYATVSSAVTLDLKGGTVRSTRIVLGSVALKPWRLIEAETRLVGARLEDALLRTALAAALKDARPVRGNEFKVRLAGNAALRALMLAGGAV